MKAVERLMGRMMWQAGAFPFPLLVETRRGDENVVSYKPVSRPG